MRPTMKAVGLVLIGIVVLGCAVTRPAVVTAPDEPFPAAFAEANQWQPFEIGSLPGAPTRFGSLDVLVKQLDGYLQAGRPLAAGDARAAGQARHRRGERDPATADRDGHREVR
jgi:hypothetical protein